MFGGRGKINGRGGMLKFRSGNTFLKHAKNFKKNMHSELFNNQKTQEVLLLEKASSGLSLIMTACQLSVFS